MPHIHWHHKSLNELSIIKTSPIPTLSLGNFASYSTSEIMQPLEVEKCNILSKFEEWKLELSGKKILIFLDYDGTCTPIVNNPNEAILSNDMREAIRRLQEYFITGVITGRSLEKIQSFVQIQDNLFYAGSHGFDIQGPKDTSIRNSVAADIIPKLASIRSSLLESFKDISGADVEDNVYSITVHYR